MATSAQDRLNKLLPQRSKPTNPDKNGLSFYEQELLDYQNKQQKATGPLSRQPNVNQDEGSPAEEDDFVLAQVQAKPKVPLSNDPSRGRQNAQVQQGRVPDIDINQGVLARGAWRDGLPATRGDQDGDHHEAEPVSSSHERLGHFCIWSLVTKFPYKYMQDPDNKVSRRFFASEKIFERNWHV